MRQRHEEEVLGIRSHVGRQRRREESGIVQLDRAGATLIQTISTSVPPDLGLLSLKLHRPRRSYYDSYEIGDLL